MKKHFGIYILWGSLLLFFIILGWLSYALISSEKKAKETEWHARLDGIAAMVGIDVDAAMIAIIKEESAKGIYEYMPASILTGGGQTDQALSTLASVSKPDYIKGYFQITPEAILMTPEPDSSWMDPYLADDKKIKYIYSESNRVVKYRNLTSMAKYDPRLARMAIKGHIKPSNQGGWVRLQAPDRGFAFVWDDNNLWALLKVATDNETYIQGILFDWTRLKKVLMQRSGTLLPDMDLVPGTLTGSLTDGITMSSIPASLIYGKESLLLSNESGNYLTLVLGLIWLIALVAATGVLWLVLAMIKLERRRASFVSSVTHELRTPLTSFALYSEMLEDGLVSEDKKQEYYSVLSRESKRLERLIENILSYSQLQKGAGRHRKDTLTAQELFEPIADKIRGRLERAGLAFSFALSRQASVQLLVTDSIAVEQIIDNLTTNAIKYVKVEHPKIKMTVQMTMGKIVVRFQDNGPGISIKDKKSIFNAFQRSNDAIASKAPGVGLGLALSKNIALSLGGSLTLEQGALNGACFNLSLPLGLAK
ncbi:MAG: HAMP domain-containing sensor histidine kinase [Akkermansia sp.]